MKRLLCIVLASLCLSPFAVAQDWAKAKLAKSPRHQEWVTVKHDGRSLSCLVVYPEVKDKAPAVLLIHEIFGQSDWAKDEADQVAAAGYIAIEPDLLSGLGTKGGGTPDLETGGVSAVTKAVSSLPPEQVLADLDAAADYIVKDPAADGTLFVAGFCWGGGKSFAYATHRKNLKAAFVFYGPSPKADLDKISCPVYGFYAGNDARISLGIPDTKKAMKAANKTYEPVVYEGAGHGFMRAGEDPEGNASNKKAHDAAWKRWLELMKG
jgi:carboxymethylenebutenolidase